MGEKIKLAKEKTDRKKDHSYPGIDKPGSTGNHRSPVDNILHLQKTIGNRAVTRLIQSGAIQTKLTIGPPNDIYEQEADRVADQVMRMPASEPAYPENSKKRNREIRKKSLAQQISTKSLLQRQTSFPPDAKQKIEEEEEIRLKANGPSEAAPGLEQQLDTMTGPGHGLPPTARRFMEDRFGTSFDHVRIHSDSKAAQISRSLNAEAFTYRNHIYFGANRFDYTTGSGKRLLAHELTHTVQQEGIRCKIIRRRGGPTVGVFGVHTNVVNAGLIAGHAWLSYTPTAGSMTTYGTWGNRAPIGLHRDLELGYAAAATRTTSIDATDHGTLTGFAAANNSWGYINNCASFAARGWRAVTGEALSYTNWLGIPNPSSLGAGITAANGGSAAGTLTTTPPGASSSYGSSGSSAGSSGGSSTGSSGASSGSSL